MFYVSKASSPIGDNGDKGNCCRRMSHRC